MEDKIQPLQMIQFIKICDFKTLEFVRSYPLSLKSWNEANFYTIYNLNNIQSFPEIPSPWEMLRYILYPSKDPWFWTIINITITKGSNWNKRIALFLHSLNVFITK